VKYYGEEDLYGNSSEKEGEREGKWIKVKEQKYESEAALQDILYKSPEIIPIEKLGENLLKPRLFMKEAGLPGSINSVFTPIRFSHLLAALAVNSGPLSDLTCSGIPLKMISSNNWSMTSCEVMRRFTSIIRHSLVYSSIILSMRNALPSAVLSVTKS